MCWCYCAAGVPRFELFCFATVTAACCSTVVAPEDAPAGPSSTLKPTTAAPPRAPAVAPKPAVAATGRAELDDWVSGLLGEAGPTDAPEVKPQAPPAATRLTLAQLSLVRSAVLRWLLVVKGEHPRILETLGGASVSFYVVVMYACSP